MQNFSICKNFVQGVVIKNRITKMYCKYFDGELWPYHLFYFINSILYTLDH